MVRFSYIRLDIKHSVRCDSSDVAMQSLREVGLHDKSVIGKSTSLKSFKERGYFSFIYAKLISNYYKIQKSINSTAGKRQSLI